jgi:hypothetical protein
VQGFIEWLAMYEPKTAAALFARVLPYFINVGGEVPDVVSEAEMEVMLKELGLPVGLIEHMQTAPAPRGRRGEGRDRCRCRVTSPQARCQRRSFVPTV